MVKFKTIHSKPQKSNVWRLVKVAGLGLLAVHALHRRAAKKKKRK